MNPFYLFLEKTEQIIGNQNGELVILCFAYYVDGRFLYVTGFLTGLMDLWLSVNPSICTSLTSFFSEFVH